MAKYTRLSSFFRSLLLMMAFVPFLCLLYGCGSGTSSDSSSSTSSASSVDLLVSSSELGSTGTSTVTLTALVKDSSNRALSGQEVTFTASSGILEVTSGTTDSSGQATATLGTGGDKTNRTITITAKAGSVSASNTVGIVGTAIDISGQDALVYGASAQYTITLKDSAGTGIANKTVTVSCHYNTLSASTVTTNSSGQATVTMTGTDTQGRSDTISATAMNATGTKAVSVSNVTFSFTTPASGSTININTWTTVTVQYAVGAVPQAGVTVSFTTSRGTLSAASAVTDSAGNASVQVKSTTVGTADLTATVSGGPSAQVSIEFVATTPASITLQADPTVIGTNSGTSTTQRSTITTVLRDAEGNLVKNKKVNFTLTADPSVGYLSPDTATTNSAGSASVLYIAGAASSPTNGVTVKATVEGTALTTTTNLTVASTSLFISVGTGPKISSDTTEVYRKDYAVIVTDAAGNPVPNATVTATITPVAYMKGYWDYNAAGTDYYKLLTLTSSHPNPAGSPYADPIITTDYCGNEDLIYWGDASHASYLLNGRLDAGEDYNGNGALDPATIASVTGSVTTNSDGYGTLSVRYTKRYATWVYVRLDVTVFAAGTEGKANTTFLLTAAADDYSFTGAWPPDSPFGQSTTCADAN